MGWLAYERNMMGVSPNLRILTIYMTLTMTGCKDERIFSKLPIREMSFSQPCLEKELKKKKEKELNNLPFLSIEDNMTRWLCEVVKIMK